MDTEAILLSPEELKEALKQFRGGNVFFQFMDGIRLTEGVEFLQRHADCHWLVAAIWAYQFVPAVAEQRFQVIDVEVDLPTRSGTVKVTDGNENLLHQQRIATDLPLASLRLYFTDNTILLPQEY